MKLTIAQAYRKAHKYFADKEIANPTDEQIQQYFKDNDIQVIGTADTETKKDPTKKEETSGSGSSKELAGALSELTKTLSGINEKVEKLESDMQERKKTEQESQKEQLQSKKQELVDKAVKEKKISADQADKVYGEYVKNETITPDQLEQTFGALPVNPAFKGNEDEEEEKKGGGKQKIETTDFNPDKPWSEQRSQIRDKAIEEVAGAVAQ